MSNLRTPFASAFSYTVDAVTPYASVEVTGGKIESLHLCNSCASAIN